MGGMHEFWLRCKALFAKRRLDREMAEELDFHQTMLREKLLRQGVPEAIGGGRGAASVWQSDALARAVARALAVQDAGESVERCEFFDPVVAEVAGFYLCGATDAGLGRGREYGDLFAHQWTVVAAAPCASRRRARGAWYGAGVATTELWVSRAFFPQPREKA